MKPFAVETPRISTQGGRFAGLPVAFEEGEPEVSNNGTPLGSRVIELARAATSLHLTMLESQGKATAFAGGWNERGGRE